jgi:hypothetical protein
MPGYDREVTITETGPDLQSPGTGYKTVAVTVGWTHPDGTPRLVTLATVVTELPR